MLQVVGLQNMRFGRFLEVCWFCREKNHIYQSWCGITSVGGTWSLLQSSRERFSKSHNLRSPNQSFFSDFGGTYKNSPKHSYCQIDTSIQYIYIISIYMYISTYGYRYYPKVVGSCFASTSPGRGWMRLPFSALHHTLLVASRKKSYVAAAALNSNGR